MKTPSLRISLLLQVLGFVTVALGLFSWLIFTNFSRILRQDADDLLLSNARALTTSIETFWQTHPANSPRESSLFRQLISEWMEEAHGNAVALGTILNLFDDKGQVVAFSGARPDILDAESVQALAAGGPDSFKYQYQSLIMTDGKRVTVRSVTVVAEVVERKATYLVQVAMPLVSINEPLSKLQYLLLAFLPAFLLASGALGFWLIRSTFQPLSQFIDSLNTLGSHQLDQRIVPAGAKEIRLLADNFNSLLDRIQKAFNSQRQVFEDMSHQLKTPLAVMKGEIEVALTRKRTVTRYQELLVSNLEEIDRMSSLVEKLLTLARFDGRQVKAEPSLINVDSFLTGVATFLAPMAERRGLEIKVDSPPGLHVNADRTLLAQALLNLLENAVKYAAEGSVVSLRGRKRPYEVVLGVHNLGQPIPEAEIPHLYERFYRGHAGLQGKGFGLGLSIVKGICELHKGNLEVTSTAEAGTEISLVLPSGRKKKAAAG